MSARRLTPRQEVLLWIVEQNEPLSVSDAAMHAMTTDGAARSCLDSLERRGLITRTYTGHHRGSQYAYKITDAGSELAQEPECDPDECAYCGRTGGNHLRACVINPERMSRA